MKNTTPSSDGQLNGFSPNFRHEVGARLRDANRAQPLGRRWSTTTAWVSGFKTSTTARAHTIRADETADFLSDDSAPTAAEYILAALGSCLTAGMVMQTTLRQIPLQHLEIHVRGRFDNVVRSGSTAQSDGERGEFALFVTADVRAAAPDAVLHELWESVVAASPVAATLLSNTPVVATLTVNAPSAEHG